MKKNKAGGVVERFNKLDFHDDGLTSIAIHPSNKNHPARVTIKFRHDSTAATKVLSFRDCANLRYIMDFDVLAENWFAQTDGTVSISDVVRMQKFVHVQMRHWHVTYMPLGAKDRPIKKKLASIARYALFRVRFFGGVIEVLAKDFRVSGITRS